jgi:hypothetical protein
VVSQNKAAAIISVLCKNKRRLTYLKVVVNADNYFEHFIDFGNKKCSPGSFG